MEYKSKCRFPLLIALEGEIRQIRPGEIVVISESISHPYLELITIPIKKKVKKETSASEKSNTCLLYTSPSPRDRQKSRMPSSA